MSLSAIDAYQTYNALKLHFTSDYNYFKYNGKTRCNAKTFSSCKDKFFFEKISRKFRTPEDYKLFCISNLLNEVTYIRQFEEDAYFERKKIIESLEYYFKKDLTFLLDQYIIINNCLRVVEGQHPAIVQKLLSSEIQIESFIILDSLLNFMPYFDDKIQEPIIWRGAREKCNAYEPFIRKYIDIKKYANTAYQIQKQYKNTE